MSVNRSVPEGRGIPLFRFVLGGALLWWARRMVKGRGQLKMVMQRFAFVVLVLAAVWAQAFPVQAAPSVTTAEAFVKSLADKAINAVAEPGIPDEERARRFRDLFTTSFDVPAIGQFVLGRYWRKATEPEKKEFLTLFEDVAVLTWAGRFKDYKGQTLTVKGSKPGNEGDILVESSVDQKEGHPLSVVWRLVSEEAGFKARDLVVDGVSMAITYRSEYTSVLQRAGGKMDGLLEALKTKVAQLQGVSGPAK